ncbi:hypothetical protein V1514DRAFT_350899 [Lipomyces japonicus]|uniref:uncharacterized protein n=1 Tax=Lipomyces japonicus TaxID=56871 RepID=UPI0034CF2827
MFSRFSLRASSRTVHLNFRCANCRLCFYSSQSTVKSINPVEQSSWSKKSISEKDNHRSKSILSSYKKKCKGKRGKEEILRESLRRVDKIISVLFETPQSQDHNSRKKKEQINNSNNSRTLYLQTDATWMKKNDLIRIISRYLHHKSKDEQAANKIIRDLHFTYLPVLDLNFKQIDNTFRLQFESPTVAEWFKNIADKCGIYGRRFNVSFAETTADRVDRDGDDDDYDKNNDEEGLDWDRRVLLSNLPSHTTRENLYQAISPKFNLQGHMHESVFYIQNQNEDRHENNTESSFLIVLATRAEAVRMVRRLHNCIWALDCQERPRANLIM